MQTVGIFNEDEDSDYFLDQDEIIDTPTINEIMNETTNQDADTSASSTASSTVQINKVNTVPDTTLFTEHFLPTLTT